MNPEEILEIFQEEFRELVENRKKYPNVTLVYPGTKITNNMDTGEPCLTIGVIKKIPETELRTLNIPLIPPLLVKGGIFQKKQIKTDVVEAGILYAPPRVRRAAGASPKFPDSEDNPAEHQAKFRPKVPAGVSAIVCGSTACTSGIWVWSKKLQKPIALQCYHCNPMSATCPDKAHLQPSPLDHGTLADGIGKFLAGNIDNPYTDISAVEPSDPSLATKQIFHLVKYKGAKTPNPGDVVIKSGRTSGVTRGRVLSLQGGGSIQYPDKLRYKYDLIVVDAIVQGGDSTSWMLVVHDDGSIGPEVAGSLFAGNDAYSLATRPENIKSDPALIDLDIDYEYDFEAQEQKIQLYLDGQFVDALPYTGKGTYTYSTGITALGKHTLDATHPNGAFARVEFEIVPVGEPEKITFTKPSPGQQFKQGDIIPIEIVVS